MVDIAVIILTYNESQHIKRCIHSVKKFATQVFVVDSFSMDSTVTIARDLGATVLQRKWTHHADQFQWGLDNCDINTEWVMRMDADEYVTSELAQEIEQNLERVPTGVNGVYVKRRVYFLGKWIRHGGYYPVWLLRIWRNRTGFCEQKLMDEHIKLHTGRTVKFAQDIVDDNKNHLAWWTEKHNNYSTREAVELLNYKYCFRKTDEVEPHYFGSQEQRKRWLKKQYASLPLFMRPALYFFWRYCLKFGFVDGRAGLMWHGLQGFWYRFLVDSKIYQIEKNSKDENRDIAEIIKDYYGIDITGL